MACAVRESIVNSLQDKIQHVMEEFLDSVSESQFCFEFESRRRSTSCRVIIRVKRPGAVHSIFKTGFVISSPEEIRFLSKFLNHLKEDWQRINTSDSD